MTLAVSKAVEEGAGAVACASTGNTSASAAAYAARAGIECLVVLPAGNVALGKLAQAIRHGARVVAVDGSFDDALELVRKVTAERPIVLVNSINPYRILGQQSGAWEVLDALGEAPAVHALPVGNAGNITAYWKGYGVAAEPAGDVGLPGGRGCPPGLPANRWPRPETVRDRHPDRLARLMGRGGGGPGRVGRAGSRR